MEKDFSARIVSLQEVYQKSYELAQIIIKSSVDFDLVIAIARGGVLPARLLCDFLNIHRLTSVQVKHYQEGAKQMEEAEIVDPLRVDIKGKSVLLVDDVNDSGETLKTALEHVESLEPKIVKTAVLHEKSHTIYETDFTSDKLEKWKWLIYQWAATEDVLEFLNKDNMLQESNEKAREYLIEKYDLDVDKQLFKQIMQMKQNYD